MFYFKLDELNKPIVEEGIFKFGKPTKHLVVPNGVTRVLGLKTKRDLEERKYGWDIFYGSYYQNDFLESLVLPSSVKVIGEKAFEHAHALKEVKLNEGLEEIRLSAFLGDKNLKLVDLPNTVKTINDWAFDLIDDLCVTFKGTKEQFNKIKKGPEWCSRGTVVKCMDGEIHF